MSDLSMSSHQNLPNQMIGVIYPHSFSSSTITKMYRLYIYIYTMYKFYYYCTSGILGEIFDTNVILENRTEKSVNGEIATTEFCWIDLKPCTHSQEKTRVDWYIIYFYRWCKSRWSVSRLGSICVFYCFIRHCLRKCHYLSSTYEASEFMAKRRCKLSLHSLPYTPPPPVGYPSPIYTTHVSTAFPRN